MSMEEIPEYAREQQDTVVHCNRVETFNTGMIRDVQQGKMRYDLLPPDALKRLTRVYTKGAEKYAPRNWEKGSPFSRVWASFMRHAMAYWLKDAEGSSVDDHLAQACWNLMTLMAYEERIKAGTLPAELDDMSPTKENL